MIVKIFLKPLTQKNCRKNDQTMSIDAEVTTASLMKRKTDAHNKMNGKKQRKQQVKRMNVRQGVFAVR